MEAQAAATPPRSTVKRPSDIVAADPRLHRAFLVHSIAASPQDLQSDERAARFLLWLAVDGRDRYPDIDVSPDFLAFLSEPVPPYPTRLCAFVRIARPHLRERFGGDVKGYVEWYRGEGLRDLGLACLATAETARSDLPGVNLFGFADAVMGIGEDARSLAKSLQRAGIPVCLVDRGLSAGIGTSGPSEFAEIRSPRPLFPVNLFALPPVETARLVAERGEGILSGRKSIGWWPWELTSLPAAWRGVFDLVDEIWAPSRFLAEVYGSMTQKPVHVVPPYLNLPQAEPFERRLLGIEDDAPLFLALFDHNSFVARKNPAGAVTAFQRAFPNPNGPERLLVKSINAASHPKVHSALVASAEGDARIRFVDEAWSRPRLAGLIAASDVFVSLHRSEGFGRVVAEAMALGTRVVATGWSGPADFLDGTVGDPVAYHLRDVEPGEYILSEGSRWAEPNLDDAAAKLRRARADIGSDALLRQRAQARVSRRYGLDVVAAEVAARLEALAACGP